MSTDPKNWRPGDIVTVGQLPPSDVPPVGSMGPRLPSPEFMRAWRARRTADAVEE